MRSISVAVTVSESGSVTHELYSDQNNYQVHVAPNNYGSPYLGAFDNSDDWRRALGAYVTQTAKLMFSLEGIHGEALVHVDETCSMYVFRIDSDR